MSLLRERKTWKRHPSPSRVVRDDLTVAEQAHARAALRVLRVRMGSWGLVATTMGYREEHVTKLASKRGKLQAGVVEDILTGAWSALRTCLLCGRCAE